MAAGLENQNKLDGVANVEVPEQLRTVDKTTFNDSQGRSVSSVGVMFERDELVKH